jgi:NADPH:quinone reductase-like Zn-dependent oxidoreductase
MKAIVTTQFGNASKAFAIRDMEAPSIGPGEALIEVATSGINFADVLARNGLYREAPPLPNVLGYDVVGTVVKVGTESDAHWIGKKVVALTRFGGYAQFAKTKVLAIAEVPADLSNAKACALATQWSTAYYASHHLMNVFPGENVLVHAAAGGVGSALVQLLLAKKCTVFATAGNDDKVGALRQKGVIAFNYNEVDYASKIKESLGDKRLDVSFNSIAGTTFKKDMRLLGAGGRLVLYGFSERSGKRGGKLATMKLLWDMGILLPIMTMATSKSVLGVNMLKIADHKPEIIGHCMTELVKLAAIGAIDPMVGGEFPASQMARAHTLLEQRQTVGKLVVHW